ncbi:MAG: ATP-dependent DNA ligase [Chloroflexaceae bacterium]|nr:ATP-dependent DNA ligase [Chloroflexaceae bacterium]
MRAFAELYTALDETTRTSEKVAALARYFAAAPPADAAWALYFLSGRKPRQVIGSRRLSEWAIEAAGVPAWLFGECYDAVGDFAETVALLLADTPPAAAAGEPAGLALWIEERLLPLREADAAIQRAAVLRAWSELDQPQRFLWNKLITGGFRVGVSQRLVVRALAQVSGVEDTVIAHRLMGDWTPSADWYRRLLAGERADADVSRPYPFFLAHSLEDDPASLGAPEEWQAEWKWDGIRAQLVRREGQCFLWSRGEELITERFPELAAAAAHLPDGTVLDGEVLPFRDGAVLPFSQLQRRIGRKQLTRKILAEVPVALFAYDLLEADGRDLRGAPLGERRARLEEVLGSAGDAIRLSPLVAGSTWEELAAAWERSREVNAEGLMLKRRASPYRVGRVRGDWWKWKVAPYTVDAVLIYAQRGSGKRASLYTDYTFGVWDGDTLVPFAKAYSGLTDAEIREVDAFVRRNTVEQFGPVRTVRPELVFELAFEGLQSSNRHKAGIAVRFPRILRWRRDKPPREADTLEMVRAMLREE